MEGTMNIGANAAVVTVALSAVAALAPVSIQAQQDHRYVDGGYNEGYDGRGHYDQFSRRKHDESVQLGPRPFFLVNGMQDGRLKDRLMQCQNGPFYRTDFSIGHRGAGLQFPSTRRVVRGRGAVARHRRVRRHVHQDGQLVCGTPSATCTRRPISCHAAERPVHSIVDRPGRPEPGAEMLRQRRDTPEFKSLKGKMDASIPVRRLPRAISGRTATWRTDLYTSRGTLLTHAESIQLIKSLGGKFTPELKYPDNPDRVIAIFGSQQNYAQKMIDEYKNAGIDPKDVWPQSFNIGDILYWIQNEPRFGKQAVYLDDWSPPAFPLRSTN
jgi:glycerophosphoryl diester phosphodiesterase